MTAFRSVFLLLAVAVMAFAPVRALAQPIAGQLPGIVATGFGAASEPAQSATLQFLLGSDQFFGMGAPIAETIEAEPGTPEAGWAPVGGPSIPGRLTEDQLAPVVESLMAAGVAQDAIEVTVPVTSSFFGPGGPEAGQIEVVVDQPDEAVLVEIVAAVRDAAPDAGLAVLHVGVEYEATDCVALIQQARDAAIADARERAEGLATGLGVTLGELVQASEAPYFGYPDGSSCAPEGTESFSGPYGPGTYPDFNPESTEATVSVQVTLTFAIGVSARREDG